MLKIDFSLVAILCGLSKQPPQGKKKQEKKLAVVGGHRCEKVKYLVKLPFRKFKVRPLKGVDCYREMSLHGDSIVYLCQYIVGFQAFIPVFCKYL